MSAKFDSHAGHTNGHSSKSGQGLGQYSNYTVVSEKHPKGSKRRAERGHFRLLVEPMAFDDILRWSGLPRKTCAQLRASVTVVHPRRTILAVAAG